MPIYEYHCDECRDDFELLVKTAADGDQVSCPTCESVQTTKKFSAFATVSNKPVMCGDSAMCSDPDICGNPAMAGPCAAGGGCPL